MSEFGSKIGHVEGEECLFIFRKIDPDGSKFAIRLNDAWKFSERHNENFEAELAAATVQAFGALGMGDVTISKKTFTQRMSALANTIQGGIDGLLKYLPEEENLPAKAIGEISVRADGIIIHQEVVRA